MPSLKEVRNRITSVNSTQQITKAMKMVAAAKLRKSQDAIMQLRPYAAKLNDILSNVSATVDSNSNNPYTLKREINKVLIVVVTSDRGLCGAFNSGIFKGVNTRLNEAYSTQLASGNVDVLCIGRKGRDYLKKRGFNVIEDYANMLSTLSFDEVRKAAEFAMRSYSVKRYDVVEIVYNEFKNVATQIVRTEQFLPVQEKPVDTSVASVDTEYLFEPDKQEIVNELIPKSLKVQFYKCVLESNASENGARMTAMDKATENAGELLKALKLTYNRTRQAAITKEILEIVGGADAL